MASQVWRRYCSRFSMQWKMALPKIWSKASVSPKNSPMKACSQLATSSARSKDWSGQAFVSTVASISVLGGFSFRPFGWRYEHQAAVATGGSNNLQSMRVMEQDQLVMNSAHAHSRGDTDDPQMEMLLKDIDRLDSMHDRFCKYGRDRACRHFVPELLLLWMQSHRTP